MLFFKQNFLKLSSKIFRYKEVLVKNENISVNYEKNVTFETVKRSVLSLNVYYKADYFTEIKDKISIDIDTFISNLGGVIGVFLGINLLSIIEIFEILFEISIMGFYALVNQIVEYKKKQKAKKAKSPKKWISFFEFNEIT